MRWRETVVAQFRRPQGALGHLAGLVMATRRSNLLRNRWTIDLLGIAAADRVLELGCGPGVALAEILARAREGFVVGIDHSPVMLAQAARRNRAALAAGRLALHCRDVAAADALAGFAAPFDKVLSVNVLQFLTAPQRANLMGRLAPLLRPGGTIAVTFQPRGRNASRSTAEAFAATMTAAFGAAGYTEIRSEILPLAPVPALCVLASRPG